MYLDVWKYIFLHGSHFFPLKFFVSLYKPNMSSSSSKKQIWKKYEFIDSSSTISSKKSVRKSIFATKANLLIHGYSKEICTNFVIPIVITDTIFKWYRIEPKLSMSKLFDWNVNTGHKIYFESKCEPIESKQFLGITHYGVEHVIRNKIKINANCKFKDVMTLCALEFAPNKIMVNHNGIKFIAFNKQNEKVLETEEYNLNRALRPGGCGMDEKSIYVSFNQYLRSIRPIVKECGIFVIGGGVKLYKYVD